jgi:hypothetical protein
MDEEEFVRDLVRSTVEEEIGDLPIAQVQVRRGVDEFENKIFWVNVIYQGGARRIDSNKTAAVLHKLVSRLWERHDREEDFGFPILSWLPEFALRTQSADAV